MHYTQINNVYSRYDSFSGYGSYGFSLSQDSKWVEEKQLFLRRNQELLEKVHVNRVISLCLWIQNQNIVFYYRESRNEFIQV